MIRVKVHAVGLPLERLPIIVVLPADATVKNLLDLLRARYPQFEAMFRERAAYHQIFVNNKQVTSPNERLAEEDGKTAEFEVLVLNPVEGGSSLYATTFIGI